MIVDLGIGRSLSCTSYCLSTSHGEKMLDWDLQGSNVGGSLDSSWQTIRIHKVDQCRSAPVPLIVVFCRLIVRW
jgi:hypothetical protein